ncbi:MAG: hypothetical protein V2B18_06265 [Pseudomonadota bacterium]
MKKAFFLAVMLPLILGVLPLGFSADKDGPADPTTPPLQSPLDPNWKRFSPPPLAPGELPDCHRVQFGKQNCQDCHQKETPESYKQWLGSKHGINSVKCGICHGDVSNYRSMPDKTVCIGCHSEQVKHMPAQALVTNCSYCHKSHWFTVHKIDAYKAFGPDRTERFKVPGF